MSQAQGRLVGSAFLITASTYFTYGLGLVVGAIVARSLGPELFGQYAYLVWFSGWLVAFANHGITTTAIRFVSEFRGRGDEAGARTIHSYLLRLQWVMLGLVIVGFVGASLAVPDSTWAVGGPILTLAAAVCVMSRAMYLFDVSIAKGYGSYHIEAYSTVLIGIATAVAALVLWWLHASIGDFVAMYVFSSVAMYVLAGFQLRSAGVRASNGALAAGDQREVLRHLGWTALLVGVGVFSKRAIETFVLNAYWNPEQVGFFTLAGSLARGSTELLTVGLSTILLPTMGHAFGASGMERVHEIFRKAMRYFIFLGILLAGTGSLLALPAVSLLYGASYQPVAFALQVMQITAGLTISEAAIGALLATTGRQSVWAKTTLLPVGISAIAAPLLVPHYGIAGALISSTIARIIGFAVLAVIAFRSQPVGLPWRSFGALAASGLLATLLALGTQTLLPGAVGQILATAVFVVALLVLSLMFGAWQRTDAALVKGLIGRFPPIGPLLGPIARYLERLP